MSQTLWPLCTARRIAHRVSIEKRPEPVEQRERLGDWGADTLVGKAHQGALVSLVERKSRYILLTPVTRRQANLVGQVTILLLLPFVAQVHTITGDNGKEFAEYRQIVETLKAVFYFAHPYSAWERSTNENTNGLVRQDFPKNTNFSKATNVKARAAADKLNQRPRKCFAFRTPFEVFFEHLSICTCDLNPSWQILVQNKNNTLRFTERVIPLFNKYLKAASSPT